MHSQRAQHVTTNPLDRYNALPVRDVASIPGPVSEELFRLAALGRRDWTLPDWLALLAELDACNEPVSTWREFRE